MAMTAAQFIEAKGGPAAVAKKLGFEPDRVRMMKHRIKLHRAVWPELMSAYPELTLEVLKRMERASARALAKREAAKRVAEAA